MSPSFSMKEIREKSAKIGFQRRIEIPEIAAGEEVQYDVDTSADIQTMLRRFGSGNYIQIVNLDAIAVEVRLDYVPNRALYAPGGSVIVEDDTMFQSFSVRNISATPTAEGRIIITFGMVRPQSKSMPVDGVRRRY